jgi:hypothetical protein
MNNEKPIGVKVGEADHEDHAQERDLLIEKDDADKKTEEVSKEQQADRHAG